MRLSNAVRDFLAEAERTHQIGPETARKYRADLEGLASWIETHHSNNVVALTPQLVRSYFLARSNKGLAAGTLNRIRGALASFSMWCLRNRVVAEDPMRLVGFVRVPETPPRPYATEVRAAPNGRGYSEQMVRVRTKAWAAMLPAKDRVTPHRFRHSYATAMLELTGNLRTVQKLLGHARSTTTEKYTEMNTQQIRQVIRRAKDALPTCNSQRPPRPASESS